RGAPPDIVLVNNFRDRDRPRALRLPAGRGHALADDIRDFVDQLRPTLRRLFESERFKTQRTAVASGYQDREKALVEALESEVRGAGFALVQIQLGPYTKPEVAPLVKGEPIPIEKLAETPGDVDDAQLEELRQRYQTLSKRLEETFRASREIQRALKKRIHELEREFAAPILADLLEDIKAAYQDPRLSEHLDELRDRILVDLRRLLEEESDEEAESRAPEEIERLRPYLVNVLVDNSGADGPPIVVETSPNYRNLFGTIEKVVDRSGHGRSDFLHIKAGSVLRANGGFLVLQLTDAISEPGVWAALKRTLKSRLIDIQSFDPYFLFSASALKPEPIEIDVRAIVIGNTHAYYVLSGYDPDFYGIFKVRADFDSVMTRDAEGIARYATFIRNLSESEGLRVLDRTGVARVVEEGARWADQGGKLSTLFSEIADLVREASYWADEEGATVVGAAHVDRAVRARRSRVALPEEKIQELILDGTLRIQTEGSVIGQINGLSVYDLGDHAFGKPTRITVQTALGQGGIVSIERESDLSGRTFNKAVLILDGLFRALFGQEQPISVHATLAFEQSYGEVDGDSASVAEVCALFSSLAEVPLRQDLALTGSIDQLGHVQPIGGVNEKVTGFYEVCRARGLTGTQGVLVPQGNAPDLMLEQEVVEDCRAGRFHVYAISRFEEALELLSGVPIGTRGADGRFPEDSLYGRIEDKLYFYAERMKEHGRPDGEGGPEGGNPPGEETPGSPVPPGPRDIPEGTIGDDGPDDPRDGGSVEDGDPPPPHPPGTTSTR
ncbi:MAG: AAA family ATPase, partial [Candidatus Eisenbacteria bacterium]|nr:AAA family ATPase [Candidatus Eisenbacteria bacterium]